MRDIDELIPEVAKRAPSVPEPIAVQAIRDAAREFCTRTKSWRQADRLTVVGPDSIAVSAITDAYVDGIEAARLDGRPLEAKDVGWLDVNVPNWDLAAADHGGVPRYVTQLQPNTLTVVPRTGSGELDVRLILIPSRDALTLPDFLVDLHGTQIGAGAAGMVLTLPDENFGDREAAPALLASFDAYITRVAAQRPSLRPPRRTRAHFF